MQQINISEIMTQDVTCVDKDTTLAEVTALMHRHTRSCLVITESDKPIGIITERDMVKILSEFLTVSPTRTFYVSDFMSSPPVVINKQATLYEALVITQARKIRHLPVVDDREELVGLLSQTDIANAHFSAIEKQRDIIEHSIQERTKELREANEELKALSLQDALLGIGNRRSMEIDVQFTHAAAVRYKRPYSIALLDVDCFKLYNDHYGHQAGDGALKSVVEVVKNSVRNCDRLYRYGGEELLLLLPETSLEPATQVSERVIKSLFNKQLPHCLSPYKFITLSAGTAALGEEDKIVWEDVVAAADKCLYRAKNMGRNRICNSGEEFA